jgi:hypothetical protein
VTSRVRAYLRAHALDLELQGLDAEHTFDLDEIIARARVEIAAERKSD